MHSNDFSAKYSDEREIVEGMHNGGVNEGMVVEGYPVADYEAHSTDEN